MAIFRGSTIDDQILFNFLSPRVRTDPAGLTGTGDAVGNIIFGYGGADVIQTGPGGEIGNEVYGGLGPDNISVDNSTFGNDRLYGGEGQDTIYGGIGAAFIDGGTGADYMFGSEGYQHYVVDDPGDVVEDIGSDQDGITSTFSFRLAEDSTIEDMFLADGWYAPELPTAKWAIGNKANNTIQGNSFDNDLQGRGGSDWLIGMGGDDFLLGGKGNDLLQGGDGDDTIRGQEGGDRLRGEEGADILIGGRGRDFFQYDFVTDFDPDRPDTIRAGDGAIAFEGAGAAKGDLIRLPRALHANEDDPPTPMDFDEYLFGGTGKGHVSIIDQGALSLVRVNVDDDSEFEVTILIEDGAVRASEYTRDDFQTMLL